MQFVVNVINQIMELLENIRCILHGRIWINRSIQLSLANLDCCNIITNKNIPFMCNLINKWTTSNMGIKQKREMSKFPSQKNLKFTWTTIKNGLSSTIFVINGIYIEKAHFVRLSMLIQRVFTFCKILFPFTFTKSASFKSSRCLFQLWEKYEYSEWNKSSMHFTIGIWDIIYTIKLVRCAMQWMSSTWGAY